MKDMAFVQAGADSLLGETHLNTHRLQHQVGVTNRKLSMRHRGSAKEAMINSFRMGQQ